MSSCPGIDVPGFVVPVLTWNRRVIIVLRATVSAFMPYSAVCMSTDFSLSYIFLFQQNMFFSMVN